MLTVWNEFYEPSTFFWQDSEILWRPFIISIKSTRVKINYFFDFSRFFIRSKTYARKRLGFKYLSVALMVLIKRLWTGLWVDHHLKFPFLTENCNGSTKWIIYLCNLRSSVLYQAGLRSQDESWKYKPENSIKFHVQQQQKRPSMQFV